MKNINKLMSLFKEYLTILNRSPLTIRQHIWRLDQFILFVSTYDLKDLQDITQEHILDYQKYRHYRQNIYDRHDAISTQNHHIGSIKCFFHWLKQEGYLAHDPARDVSYAKEPKRLPKAALTNTEVKKILRQPDTTTKEGYRDRTILEVLYSTGIRKSELINLQLQDIDYEQGLLRVNNGKGNKDRIVPLGKISSQYVENYVKGIRPWFYNVQQTQSLFVSQKGRHLGKSTLDEIIKKHAYKANLDKAVSIHTFRRSCATEMIKNKANLMHIKEILGHSSLETIQAYCSLSIIDLKEAHKKHHPREKDTH